MRAIAGAWLAVALLVGCSCSNETNYAKEIWGIAGHVKPGESIEGVLEATRIGAEGQTAQWGDGDWPTLTATIQKVRVEAYKASPQRSQKVGEMYTVIATAQLRCLLNNESAVKRKIASGGSYSPELRFQLMSSEGVVLREETKFIQIVPSDLAPTATVDFGELPVGLVRRARAVQVFWIYTR